MSKTPPMAETEKTADAGMLPIYPSAFALALVVGTDVDGTRVGVVVGK